MLQKVRQFYLQHRERIQWYTRITAWVALFIALLSLVAAILVYSQREVILQSVIKKAIGKAKNDYQIDLKIEQARFSGFRTLAIERISAVPENRDSLLLIEKMEVSVQIFPLLLGKVKLAELNMERGFLQLVKKDSLRNYDFLFRKKQNTGQKNQLDLAGLGNRLLNTVFYKIPEDLDVKNFDLKWVEDTTSLNFQLKEVLIDDGAVSSTILVNKNEATWHVDGEVEPDDRQLDLDIYADGGRVELPYLEKKWGLKLHFDRLSTRMEDVSYFAGKLKINGYWSAKNLLIKHPKIAAKEVLVPDAYLDARMVVGDNYMELDEASVIHLKEIEMNPFLRYTLKPHKIYELGLHTDELPAQAVFNSFPTGLFETLEGIRVQGKLQYDLDFYLDETKPEEVKFSSELRQEDFKILKFGKTNLSKINSDFIYTPYEYGKPMRDLLIGSSNPNFVPLDQISPFLKNAVLTAEDPSFFGHRGFVEEAIRKSIATNFKRKAFKRGASTISMQLVKNVYLSRQKTLARKIEEMLIVWLIEHNRLSSKSRMFEVYLNLIEWGPNVYGIAEASRHYFDKHPSELNLGESIYLASIVPRPKSSLYFFEYQGNLRASMLGYFNSIGGLMARRGLAPADSTGYGFYDVRLKEDLRYLLSRPDSLILDSLMEGNNSDLGELLMEPLIKKSKADSMALHQPKKLRFLP